MQARAHAKTGAKRGPTLRLVQFLRTGAAGGYDIST